MWSKIRTNVEQTEAGLKQVTFLCVHTPFFYKNTVWFIRIQRARFRSIFLAISRNTRLEIHLTIRKESFRPEMQFKAVFKGGKGGKFREI